MNPKIRFVTIESTVHKFGSGNQNRTNLRPAGPRRWDVKKWESRSILRIISTPLWLSFTLRAPVKATNSKHHSLQSSRSRVIFPHDGTPDPLSSVVRVSDLFKLLPPTLDPWLITKLQDLEHSPCRGAFYRRRRAANGGLAGGGKESRTRCEQWLSSYPNARAIRICMFTVCSRGKR